MFRSTPAEADRPSARAIRKGCHCAPGKRACGTGFVDTSSRLAASIDTIRLFLRKQDPSDPSTVVGLVDGGPSPNLCTHTRNLKALRRPIEGKV